MTSPSPHVSVLLDEVLSLLMPEGRQIQRAIDGTLGAGGHTRALLDAGVECVLGLDLDPQALALARVNLEPYNDRAHIVHASYLDMASEARRIGWMTGVDSGVDAILLDLGVSSMQLDTPERGFAFRHDGPLDMRFNPIGNRPPASDIVNTWDESELATLFYRYGEDPDSRKIARAVVTGRPYTTTQQLADVIEARVEEIFEMVQKEIKRSGYDGLIRAGAVITGGGGQLPGTKEVAQRVLGVPIRMAKPEKLTGMADVLRNPAYSSSVGLLRMGLQMDTVLPAEPNGNGKMPGVKIGQVLGNLFKRLLPDEE